MTGTGEPILKCCTKGGSWLHLMPMKTQEERGALWRGDHIPLLSIPGKDWGAWGTKYARSPGSQRQWPDSQLSHQNTSPGVSKLSKGPESKHSSLQASSLSSHHSAHHRRVKVAIENMFSSWRGSIPSTGFIKAGVWLDPACQVSFAICCIRSRNTLPAWKQRFFLQNSWHMNF